MKAERSPTQGRTPEIISSALTKQSLLSKGLKSEAEQRDLIALTAYYIAEKRGFAPGHEAEDWVAAEASVRRPSESEG